MQKRVSQGSVQLQGEALEVYIEDWLKDEFLEDNIIEIKKGMKGASGIGVALKRTPTTQPKNIPKKICQ